MPSILSVSTYVPPYRMTQEATIELARELFQYSFQDIDRLIAVFKNGQIENRHFSVPLEWFEQEHSFQEKNDIYISSAVEYGVKAIQSCLISSEFLQQPIDFQQIDALFFISSTGLSTPSIEAKIMNHLPFSPQTKRIPIWGLGCAGGAAGLSRAYEYCLAFPQASVLVLSVELCSLTFQKNDQSKSNLVGSSLFADGVACALVVGDAVNKNTLSTQTLTPTILGTRSTLMPHSEDVMGWEIKNDGLHVLFSKDIPSIIREWLHPNVQEFIQQYGLSMKDIAHFIAHPGGKKVIEAYQSALGINPDMTQISLDVLKEYGNMSSATVLFVLQHFMRMKTHQEEYGIITALGPGFSSELLLVQWR